MGKKKKKNWRQQVNPEKSNKMIYAVAIGLGIIFLIVVLTMLLKPQPKEKAEIMNRAVKYLEGTQGVISLKVFPEDNRVLIVYNPTDEKDFLKICRYAGIKLSNKLRDEEIRIELAQVDDTQLVYQVRMENGRLIEEKRLDTS